MILLGRVAPYLVAMALVAGALFGAYHFGESVKDEEWKARWNARDAGDKQAWALAETAEREKEQAHQQSINKAVQNGQIIIDTAVAAVAAANRESDGLRNKADAAAALVAASKGGGHSCTSATSQAATRAAMVLADVLKRADQRAGDLAAVADQARARGMTCEAAYQGIAN